MSGSKRARPRLPRGAEEHPIANERRADFFVRDRLVARVYWHATGAIERETRFDERGRMHGLERECFEDGRVKYIAQWSHGVQHGLQQQWDERGRLLVRQRFVRGTGLDVWFDLGRISESRDFVDGQRHGFERWWRDRRRVWSETPFRGGAEHGIERVWTDAGRMRRGYPRYWIAGRQVTRAGYLRAQATDPTLPAAVARDARPTRPLIRAVSAPGRGQARRPRTTG